MQVKLNPIIADTTAVNFPGFQEIMDWTVPTVDSYTKCLLHFNGADGATSIAEETGKAVTLAGTAQLDTAQKKFGVSSLLLDGNSDYITLADSADWYFGTDAFTVDFWVRYNGAPSASYLVSQIVDSGHLWLIGWGSNTISVNNYNGADTISFSAPFIPVADIWYHIAIVRIDNGNAASSWRVFVNGVAQTLTLVAGAWNGSFDNYAAALTIGARTVATTSYLNGWLDEVRISKGIARWTSDFDVPTAEYQDVFSSVSLTVNGDVDKEYKFLVLALATKYVYFTLNGDAGANYGIQLIENDSGTISAAKATGQPSLLTGFPLGLGETSLFTPVGLVKTSYSNYCMYTSGTTMRIFTLRGGVYNSISNITSITFIPDSGNFTAGTRIIVFARRTN